MLNFGGLFAIGGSYNLINDLFLKKKFAKQIQITIDRKLEKAALDESIGEFGLYRIEKIFSNDLLFKRINTSNHVTMVVMRSSGFFHLYYPELLERIKNNNLRLTIILLKPDLESISLLKYRFGDFMPHTRS